LRILHVCYFQYNNNKTVAAASASAANKKVIKIIRAGFFNEAATSTAMLPQRTSDHRNETCAATHPISSQLIWSRLISSAE